MTHHNFEENSAASTRAMLQDALRKAMAARIRETTDEEALVPDAAGLIES